MRKNAFRFALIAVAVVSAASVAVSADDSLRRHPGFVDGSAFVDLAGQDADLVEVSIGPGLLKAIARGDDGDDEASVLRDLVGVSAYVVGLEKDPAREERATRLVRETAARLEKTGWERLARVREKGELVHVLVRNGETTIDGLVVLVYDAEDSEVVFANLVGSIDLAKLGDLKGTIDVPGLEAVGETEK